MLITLLALTGFEEQCAEIGFRPGVAGIDGKRFTVIGNGAGDVSSVGERDGEVREPERLIRIESTGLAEFGDGFAFLIVPGESDGESEVGPGIVGVDLQRLVPDLNGFSNLVLLQQVVGI
jgi:hypothetical protein